MLNLEDDIASKKKPKVLLVNEREIEFEIDTSNKKKKKSK